MGFQTFVCQTVFGVDPNNPQNLIAAEVGSNQMKVSIDGGASWNVDSVIPLWSRSSAALHGRAACEPLSSLALIDSASLANTNNRGRSTPSAEICMSTSGARFPSTPAQTGCHRLLTSHPFDLSPLNSQNTIATNCTLSESKTLCVRTKTAWQIPGRLLGIAPSPELIVSSSLSEPP